MFEIRYTYFICFVLLSCCSIFKDHAPPLARQPDYYTTTALPCQYLFEKFFAFFQVFSAVGCGLLPFYRTACTLYHVFSLLSIGFFMFFQFFSQFVIFVHRHTTLYMTFLSNPTKCTKKCTMQSGRSLDTSLHCAFLILYK